MVHTEPTQTTLMPELYVNVTSAKWFTIAADELRAVLATFPRGPTEDQQFLDLGCGSGNVTRDVLLPQCPPCRRFVAVDASEDMLKYAREHFAHPKICYAALDILADDVSDFVERYGLFDRVYSLLCFNWLKDQEKALKNVVKLMKPGGEALFWFNARTPQMRFRKTLAGMQRWSKYAQICGGDIPPTVDLTGEEELLSYMLGILKRADLVPSMCQVRRDPTERYTSPEHLTQDLMATNSIRALLTEEEKQLLLEDATVEAKRLWADKEAGGSLLAVDVFVVRASKQGP
ncbi:uncharacterized protein ISCGN_006274 [Ixodes scapularis]